MSFIQLDPGYQEAHEPQVAPEDSYDLVITRFDEPYTSPKGHTIIPVSVEFEGEPDYAGFRHWLVIPGPDTEDRIKNILNLNLKRFFHVFDVPVDDGGFDPADLVGCRASGAPVIQETVEPEDGDPFTVNKLKLPKLPKED